MVTQNITNKKSSYNMFDIYKNVRREESEMGSGIAYVFSVTLVPILDETIMTNNTKLLSKEQEVMFNTYLAEANMGTLSNRSYEFDIFLGNYKGEEINE